MRNQGAQGKRGRGQNTYAFWEELRHLRIEGAEPVSIYKRLDTQQSQSLENTNGKIEELFLI